MIRENVTLSGGCDLQVNMTEVTYSALSNSNRVKGGTLEGKEVTLKIDYVEIVEKILSRLPDKSFPIGKVGTLDPSKRWDDRLMIRQNATLLGGYS